MDITNIFKPRYGLTHDPNWTRYHQWPWNYFPIQLPACTIYKSQTDWGSRKFGRIRWDIERGVAIVSRLARPDGSLLAEVLPEGRIKEEVFAGDLQRFHREDTLAASDLSGSVGFGFEWVFEIPLKPPGSLQPWHALGVVRVDGAELVGRETTLTIHRGGWANTHQEQDKQEKANAAETLT